MRIAMINGSPKLGKSNSDRMLGALEPLINNGHEIHHYKINKKPLTPEQYGELCRMDALILAFPLYVDAIPSHLFRMLVALEEYMKATREKEIYVYAIINNGYYEGHQTHIAFEILQNWCVRSGLQFGQGIGQGAGEMIGLLDKEALGHGPFKNLGRAMERLANQILANHTGETMLLSPKFPRFAWRFAATHYFWNASAKKNGLEKHDILRRL